MLAALLLTSLSTPAQNVPHLTTPHPGGMPGIPVMQSIEPRTNGVEITWDGPPGYYQVFRKTNALNAPWQPVGSRTNLQRKATITAAHGNAFFRVLGPSPRYAGSQTCMECHTDIHNVGLHTKHAGAFTNALFVAQGGQTNSACLPCHTVGFGLPTGFVSKSKTPHLAGVQCENCHGPSANHAANEYDFTARPRVEIAATMCGGCHTGSHQSTHGQWHSIGGTYDEWHSSGHSSVVADMNAPNRIDSCGRCHSGSARLSLLNKKPLPTGDANVAIGCVTCHDPHQKTAHPAHLRNPIASTNDFFLSTSDSFTSKYNPNINLCAQCHNHRGATWTSSARPPHRSPQYNMFLGTVGELATGAAPNQPGAHARLIQKQCVGCHMESRPYQSAEHPAITGHSFKVDSFDSCRSCHPLPELLVEFTATAISIQMEHVKAWLDFWAATRAPAALWTQYGTRAWEYTAPGDLSPGGPGPGSSEQNQIPNNIKKARFNLYLVLHDGSYGAHNGPYAIHLLDTARNWVRQEVDQ